MKMDWFDRLMLGRDTVERVKEAEERLRKSDRITQVLDQREQVQLDALRCAARTSREEASVVRTATPRPVRNPSLPEIELLEAAQ